MYCFTFGKSEVSADLVHSQFVGHTDLFLEVSPCDPGIL